MEIQAKFWRKEKETSIACLLCPHGCIISEDSTGICKARKNTQGILSLPFYGEISSLAVDPIEKKPLYHFLPGKTILSIGFVGCSFQCPFCQNHSISQSSHVFTEHLDPEDVVALAVKKKSFGIAYTYSEPLIHIEFILETAKLAKKMGLKNVLVSNGYINPEPAQELLPLLDAANIDVKSFNPDFYLKEIKGKLQPVLDFISLAAGKISLEITTLIIPGKNDSSEEIESIARFIADIDDTIPYHLSRYYPTFKYTIPATSFETVMALSETARKYLKYVYLGNVGLSETNTFCPSCGALLVRRLGYSTTIEGIKKNACTSCGETIPIVLS